MGKWVDPHPNADDDVPTNVETLEAIRSQRPIGIQELKKHATEIVRLVREKGVAVQIAYRGKSWRN
jgi:hypothetical protein